MEILKLGDDPVPAAQRAVEVLSAGGIVIYPTDTLYGIAVDAFNSHALQRLRALKGREQKKPISVVVSTIEVMAEHGIFSEDARAIAEKHLPGALTLVLPAQPHVPKELAVDGTIGLRIPNHSFVLALAERFSSPFTATSANRSGYATPRTVSQIFSQFGNDLIQVDLVIDAGDLENSTPSTVLRFDSGAPKIVREGVLTKEHLGL